MHTTWTCVNYVLIFFTCSSRCLCSNLKWFPFGWLLCLYQNHLYFHSDWIDSIQRHFSYCSSFIILCNCLNIKCDGHFTFFIIDSRGLHLYAKHYIIFPFNTVYNYAVQGNVVNFKFKGLNEEIAYWRLDNFPFHCFLFLWSTWHS